MLLVVVWVTCSSVCMGVGGGYCVAGGGLGYL